MTVVSPLPAAVPTAAEAPGRAPRGPGTIRTTGPTDPTDLSEPTGLADLSGRPGSFPALPHAGPFGAAGPVRPAPMGHRNVPVVSSRTVVAVRGGRPAEAEPGAAGGARGDCPGARRGRRVGAGRQVGRAWQQ